MFQLVFAAAMFAVVVFAAVVFAVVVARASVLEFYVETVPFQLDFALESLESLEWIP